MYEDINESHTFYTWVVGHRANRRAAEAVFYMKEVQENKLSETLLSDKDIAELLSVSSAWVRRQRCLRHKNEEHVFGIDAIYIGKSPRYKTSDFKTWMGNL